MSTSTIVIFDTCTIPEYYDDLHKLIALPSNFVLTYDYAAANIDEEVRRFLDNFVASPDPNPAVLAYMQPAGFKKGDAAIAGCLPVGSIIVLTRLAHIIGVRSVSHESRPRYYLDLRLAHYPYDRNRVFASIIEKELRSRNAIPMKTYMAVLQDSVGQSLFSRIPNDSQDYANLIENLGATNTQFSSDTFWRVRRITKRSKSAVPFTVTPELDAAVSHETLDNKTVSFIPCDDQTTISFYLDFHRPSEAITSGYLPRKIQLESSPKTFVDSVPSMFSSRSYGHETVQVMIPSTTSLSKQHVEYRLETLPNSEDAGSAFPFGPQLLFKVKYSKSLARVSLALGSLAVATATLAWAAFATANPMYPDPCLIRSRVAMSVFGVFLTLYSYYLWADDISLDKAKR